MKLADAYIAWTPSDYESPTAGEVFVGTKQQVISKLDHDGMKRWIGVAAPNFGGAASSEAGELKWQQLAIMFSNLWTLVVRDGVDPQKVHSEYLKIDEYRWHISPDLPGATYEDDDVD